MPHPCPSARMSAALLAILLLLGVAAGCSDGSRAPKSPSSPLPTLSARSTGPKIPAGSDPTPDLSLPTSAPTSVPTSARPTPSASGTSDAPATGQSAPATDQTAAQTPSGSAENAPVPLPSDPRDDDFVRVADYIPDLAVDLKYAGTDNFTGQVIYNFSDAYLRYGTVKKLAAAADVLREQGYRLKIWDAYRPPAAQWKLWAICPDGRYVSDPNRGYSGHSRGNTVDLTLCLPDGGTVDLPTGFDDFTAKADRDYSDCTESQRANARILEEAMIAAGFKPYSAEWWHYSDSVNYPVYEP